MDYSIEYGYINSDDNNSKYGFIKINNIRIILDLDNLFKIINNSKIFTHYNPSVSIFPYYKRNKQIVTYKEYLFNFSPKNIYYIHKNNNNFDIRRSNIEIYHDYNKVIEVTYDIDSYNNGHFLRNGKSAYVMKNPLWYLKDNTILMYCENNALIKLCPVSYKKILDFEKNNNDSKKLTFFKNAQGYICSHYKKTCLFIHQIITGCYGNGKGTMNVSVDHIDQNPLNNTYSNLRIATRKEQEENSNGIKEGTKRARKKNAKRLPEGITQDMLPKYVYYCKECYNKEKQLFREFFRIEKHPNMTKKQIAGSKSQKLTIHEKLKEIKEKLETLDS